MPCGRGGTQPGPARGGYPYLIMLCNITQNSMGQTPRGVPCQVRMGRGYPAGGYPIRVPPSRVPPSPYAPGQGGLGGGTLLGGYPGKVRYPGRVPPSRVPPWQGTPSQVPPIMTWPRGYLPGYPQQGTPTGYPPGRVPHPGQNRGGYPAGSTQVGYPPGQIRMGGTQLGQQKKYSLHGGRYASCVHTGGLSCFAVILEL